MSLEHLIEPESKKVLRKVQRKNTKELILSNCGAGEDSSGSLDSKEIKPVNYKGNQPCIFIGRKFQYFGHLIQRADSLGKTLMVGNKTEGKKRRGRQRTR